MLYVYAEVEVETPHIAELLTGSPAMVWAWANGQLALSPTVPHPANLQDDRLFIALRPGTNTLLFKLHFGDEPWSWEWRCERYGAPQQVEGAIQDLVSNAPDDVTRLLARFALVKICAAQGDERATHRALDALRRDPFSTQWDVTWANAVEQQHIATGSFLPLHDVPVRYTPVTGIDAYPTFWPQSPLPAQELLVDESLCAFWRARWAISPQDAEYTQV